MRASLFHSLRLVAAALALTTAACSSSGSSTNPDSFVGTWSFQWGSIMPMCSGVTLGDIDLTGDTVSITKIDTTHVAMMISGGGVMCDVRFTVDGSKATADSGQTCAISSSGYNAVLDVKSWTMTLAGSTIDMSMSGTASVLIVSCTPTSTGTMVRSTSDAAQGG